MVAKIGMFFILFILFISCQKKKEKNSYDKETTVEYLNSVIELGKISVNMRKDTLVLLKNIGTNPLVIYDVKSSCGCTVLSWNKEPVFSNQSLEIKLSIKTFETGIFDKYIKVYCNSTQSPILFKIHGTIYK